MTPTPVAALNIVSPINGATLFGMVGIIISPAPASGTWVNVYIDGNYLASSPPSNFSWNSATVPNGAHMIRADLRGGSPATVLVSRSVTVTIKNGSPSPTPYVTPTPPSPSPTPSGGTVSRLLPQNYGVANLPTSAQAAALVAAGGHSPEYRAANYTANHAMPSAAWLATFHAAVGSDPQTAGAPRSVTDRIDGQFTGTTDEIIRWASFKWGFDEDQTRAQAVEETHWVQSGIGDLGNGNSMGLLQGKTSDSPSTCPTEARSQNVADAELPDCQLHLSTAFAVDYALGMMYATYIGQQNYLADRTPLPGYPIYPNGTQDEMDWGTKGYWNTGTWYNAQACGYIADIKGFMVTKPWLTYTFRHNPNYLRLAPSRRPINMIRRSRDEGNTLELER